MLFRSKPIVPAQNKALSFAVDEPSVVHAEAAVPVMTTETPEPASVKPLSISFMDSVASEPNAKTAPEPQKELVHSQRPVQSHKDVAFRSPRIHNSKPHREQRREDHRPTHHKSSHKPTTKKENPIWNQVADIHQQRKQAVERKVGEVVKQVLERVPQAPQAPKIEPAKTEPVVDTQNQNSSPERTVLQPGQPKKF